MKGIIFSAAMVNAILRGTKTQTRRIIKPQPILTFSEAFWHFIKPNQKDSIGFWPNGTNPDPANPKAASIFNHCPYKVGETIYVKESWTLTTEGQALYLTDWQKGGSQEGFEYRGAGWRSPLFMPESASRIKLIITNVRIERVQDISADDCIAEGVWPEAYTQCERNWLGKWHSQWVAIHSEASWESNPWVWAISFEQVSA